MDSRFPRVTTLTRDLGVSKWVPERSLCPEPDVHVIALTGFITEGHDGGADKPDVVGSSYQGPACVGSNYKLSSELPL